MMRWFFLLMICLSFKYFTYGQLVTNNTYTPQQLVTNFLVGTGVSVSNIVYTGDADAIGYFNSANANVGINSGLLLTTGTILNNPPSSGPHGPNDSPSAGFDNGFAGDLLLEAIANNTSFNAARLEFDFVPQSDSINFNYVFASEEYLEFVNGGVNDAFGFFISGPNPAGGNYFNENIALVPGTNIPITIDNVHAGMNSNYYVDNGDGFSAPQNGSNTYVQYDGLTTKLNARAPVVCGQTYHIIIVISDMGDPVYDSGVFLEEGSFNSNGVDVQIVTQTGDSTIIEGCTTADLFFVRPSNDLTDSLSVNVTITGTATLGVDFNSFTTPIVFLPGQDSIAIQISSIDDANAEGPESIIITAYSINACGDTIVTSGTIWIVEPNVDVTVNSLSIPCPVNSTFNMVAIPTAGFGPFSYSWSSGSANDTLVVALNSSGNFSYSVTVTDFCNATETQTGTVNVGTFDVAQFTASPVTGEIPLLVNFTNTSAGGNLFNWFFGDGNTAQTLTVSPVSNVYTNEGNYVATLVVSNGQGCFDTTSVNISAFTLPNIEAPNVFSPNGDNINEFFSFINVKNVAKFECVIFNRWGNIMHTMDSLNDVWNGETDGQKAADGVYFYTFIASSNAGKTIEGQGYFHLTRK
jgi:gliding motility-associated-like protein